MHIYFIGIGGAGIGPLAMIAKQAGYQVSGSDIKDSTYIKNLRQQGLNVYTEQSGASIEKAHQETPIDWVVAVSTIIRHNSEHSEIIFAKKNNIKISERNELLNQIITDNNLKIVAAAGTHGKTTTTAMMIWLFKELGLPESHSVGAKLSFAEMGHFDKKSQYFIYECDEFERNFLNYYPEVSAITGIAWDHHEIYPTYDNYKQAFRDYIDQNRHVVVFKEDADTLALNPHPKLKILLDDEKILDQITLTGRVNKKDALLAIKAVQLLTNESDDRLIDIINRYPGSHRRMEKLANNIFSDYAHTPEKIAACLEIATETKRPEQKLVVVYEPLTNRRQHYIKDLYKHLFDKVNQIYWVPSYLAREDASLKVLSPVELINCMDNKHIAQPAELNNDLWQLIIDHQKNDDFVLLISGGGGESLDEWARNNLKA